MNEIEKAKDRYERFIRNYTTCDLLEYFSMKSIEAFQDGKKAFTILDLPYYTSKGIRGITKNFSYGQWELVQVSFSSIKYSNDYRGKKVNESDFYKLLNENKIYDEKAENVEGIDSIKLFEHLQCLTNVQFDFQTLQTTHKFNRIYQIMMCINKNSDYDQSQAVDYINFEQVFKTITGMNIDKFINIYYFMILISSTRRNTNIYDIINYIQFDVNKLGFSKEDIKKVIELQSRDYKFYKDSDNWNILKYYPIVKIDKYENKYIISNMFSLMLSFPYSIYWIIRNYYRDLKSNKFTNYFGKCFEFYFNEILDYYKINYKKLKESKKQKIKMPDWKIETDKYIFLIEQKAALFPVDTRTTTKEERYEKIEDYFNKTLVKAFEQLNAYSEPDTPKTIIRICLTFENIYMEENVKSILESKMKFESDIALNWIVNIDEMEILMHTLGEDENKFNSIIEEKIKLERDKDPNGRRLEILFAGYPYDYSTNKINHFLKLGDELKEKLKNIQKGEI